MKKLYTAMAMALIAASASAQTLYFKGSGTGLSWDEGTDLAVEQKDGKYTVTIENLSSFKMSTVSSTEGWDAYNDGALYGAMGATSNKENLGQPITLEINAANNDTPWLGEYTIVVSGDLTTLTLTTTTPEPVGFKKIYLVGTINGWSTDAEVLAPWEFDTTDGVTYWFDCTGDKILPADSKVKIFGGVWALPNCGPGDEIVPFDEPLIWANNSNSGDGVVTDEYEGTIKAEFPDGFFADAFVTFFPELKEHAGVADVVIDENAAAEYFNLQGVRVANPENGIFIRRQGNKATKVLVK